MRLILLLIFTINYSYAILFTNLKDTPNCKQFVIYVNLELDDSNFMSDVLNFVKIEGYTENNSFIGMYLAKLNYRDYAQYCIEHICSKAIKDLLKLQKIKPSAIDKALYDYNYILLKKFDASSTDEIKNMVANSIKKCTAALKINSSDLSTIIKDKYIDKLKQILYGVSPLESKMENIVILA